jgi:hypothetical protein
MSHLQHKASAVIFCFTIYARPASLLVMEWNILSPQQKELQG